MIDDKIDEHSSAILDYTASPSRPILTNDHTASRLANLSLLRTSAYGLGALTERKTAFEWEVHFIQGKLSNYVY